jgi:hypothetical protein
MTDRVLVMCAESVSWRCHRRRSAYSVVLLEHLPGTPYTSS